MGDPNNTTGSLEADEDFLTYTVYDAALATIVSVPVEIS